MIASFALAFDALHSFAPLARSPNGFPNEQSNDADGEARQEIYVSVSKTNR